MITIKEIQFAKITKDAIEDEFKKVSLEFFALVYELVQDYIDGKIISDAKNTFPSIKYYQENINNKDIMQHLIIPEITELFLNKSLKYKEEVTSDNTNTTK